MKFRSATLKERESFYKNEFKIDKAKSFFKKKPQLLAMDAGTDSEIIKHKEDKNYLFYLKFNELKTMIRSYVPEDIYYDRNIYLNAEERLRNLNKMVFGSSNCLGQELAFDIDSENVECDCKSKYPLFCKKCLRKSIKYGIRLAEKMKKDFKKVKLVYTGRGCHVHVFDTNAYGLTLMERIKLNKKLKKYAIDPWVSEGNMHLIRLPYSLNGLVSRIVIPLTLNEAKKFNPATNRKTIPKFLL